MRIEALNAQLNKQRWELSVGWYGMLVMEERSVRYEHTMWVSDALNSGHSGYLVDPASSHMLVSKIKPCMSQYKLSFGETANGSLKQL